MAACPYGARSLNWRDPRLAPNLSNPANLAKDYPTRMRGVVEKCNFCFERLAKGLKPACVEACKDKAIIFGDAGDHNSDVSKILTSNATFRRKPQLGTKPQVYYIL
jgi:molybdopterin-containing oxidoreductase family iron-sulfur binding subunit